MKILEKAISLLYDHRSSNMQGELQLYEARYLYEMGDLEGAHDCFNAGYYLLVRQKSREIAEETAREILEERFESLRN